MENTTLEDYLEFHLTWMKAGNRTKRTIDTHREEVRCFFKFSREQGIEDLKAVSRKEIDEYQTWLYYYRYDGNKPLGAETQMKKLGIIRVFFYTLVQTRTLLMNPAQGIEMPRQNSRIPRHILSVKEVKQLSRVPDLKTVYGYRDRTMIEVFYATGVRTSELNALTIEDVDFEEGFLKVIRGKGLKDRTVPLTEVSQKYLREYIERVRPLLIKNPSGNILFLTKSGKAFDRSAIHKKLIVIAQAAGIKRRVTARMLRSTMATELLKSGADLRHIQEILGHETLSTTQLYAKVVQKDLKRAHRKTHPREKTKIEDIHYEGEGDFE